MIFHSKLLVYQGVKGTMYQGFLQLLMLTPAKAFLRRSTAGPGLGNRKHQQKRINNPKGSKVCVCVCLEMGKYPSNCNITGKNDDEPWDLEVFTLIVRQDHRV